jgi:very-short-patch-repair endonuclease
MPLQKKELIKEVEKQKKELEGLKINPELDESIDPNSIIFMDEVKSNQKALLQKLHNKKSSRQQKYEDNFYNKDEKINRPKLRKQQKINPRITEHFETKKRLIIKSLYDKGLKLMQGQHKRKARAYFNKILELDSNYKPAIIRLEQIDI